MDMKDKMLEAMNRDIYIAKPSSGKDKFIESCAKICEDEMIRFAEWIDVGNYPADVVDAENLLILFKQSNNT